jgi:CHAT domain-containing protein
MLFYVTGVRNEPTTLFVVTGERTSAVSLPTTEALAPLIGQLRRTIESGATGDALRARLGAELIAPALPLLPSGVTRLIIVGDGPIQDVPFDALRLPDGRAMIERFEISSLASPATLPLLRARPEWTGGGVLALAVNDPRRRSPVTGAPMPALRRAAVEARHAATRRPGGVALTGELASEAALYTRRDSVAALHIAAHVVVDPAVVTRSAIMLSSGGGEDGNVYPSELSQLGISAGLVVLSGCRTAGAQVDGAEGLHGFTAPLLIGGTRTVIATRWDLGDRVGSEMMRDFHEQMSRGVDAGTALHAAKQRQFRAGRSPATWAVFQLTGDPAYRLAATP